jgi:hypothetical protein
MDGREVQPPGQDFTQLRGIVHDDLVVVVADDLAF